MFDSLTFDPYFLTDEEKKMFDHLPDEDRLIASSAFAILSGPKSVGECLKKYWDDYNVSITQNINYNVVSS